MSTVHSDYRGRSGLSPSRCNSVKVFVLGTFLSFLSFFFCDDDKTCINRYEYAFPWLTGPLEKEKKKKDRVSIRGSECLVFEKDKRDRRYCEYGNGVHIHRSVLPELGFARRSVCTYRIHKKREELTMGRNPRLNYIGVFLLSRCPGWISLLLRLFSTSWSSFW